MSDTPTTEKVTELLSKVEGQAAAVYSAWKRGEISIADGIALNMEQTFGSMRRVLAEQLLTRLRNGEFDTKYD